MAAAIVTGRRQSDVSGRQRVNNYKSIHFAQHGDTLAVRGMKTIYMIGLMPTTDVVFGWTITGNTIKLVSGGSPGDDARKAGRSGGGITFEGSIYGL